VFRLEEQRYGLPLAAVERVLPMVAVAALPKAPAVALGVINVGGRVIAVVDLRHRLGLPRREYGLTGHLLVARTHRRTLILPVDAVLGVMAVTADAVTSPDRLLPGIGHVAGIVALPDGLLFIHDLDAFLSLDEEQRLSAALEEVAG
jgi:purine-binding chemotaxis protein CheW